uniref:Uncharacterized protein n=1 Tax=Timema tahoe TaxID=61484 RepID=A0A7R9IL77_9NEOP|nr:unnamed protein product [Timema tahoe]
MRPPKQMRQTYELVSTNDSQSKHPAHARTKGSHTDDMFETPAFPRIQERYVQEGTGLQNLSGSDGRSRMYWTTELVTGRWMFKKVLDYITCQGAICSRRYWTTELFRERWTFKDVLDYRTCQVAMDVQEGPSYENCTVTQVGFNLSTSETSLVNRDRQVELPQAFWTVPMCYLNYYPPIVALLWNRTLELTLTRLGGVVG